MIGHCKKTPYVRQPDKLVVELDILNIGQFRSPLLIENDVIFFN